MRISDWSSDVCSSDLINLIDTGSFGAIRPCGEHSHACAGFKDDIVVADRGEVGHQPCERQWGGKMLGRDLLLAPDRLRREPPLEFLELLDDPCWRLRKHHRAQREYRSDLDRDEDVALRPGSGGRATSISRDRKSTRTTPSP